MEDQSEEQLIERGLNGDARALDALFARNTRALYQTALRVLGNPEDAEEALQEGLLSAYRNLPRFERRSQFSTWLTRIVINAALMRRRSKRLGKAASIFMVMVLGLTAAVALGGCGSSNGFFGQPQKTYTVTVTATSGTLSHSTNLTLTVE